MIVDAQEPDLGNNELRTELEVIPNPNCTGDCNGDRIVTVDEVVRGVNIALGDAGVDVCDFLDRNGDGDATVEELVAAVGAALGGCDP